MSPRPTPGMRARIQRLMLPLLAGMAALLLAAGCAHTIPDESESTLPWNMPESWQGVPYIPGMEAQ